MAEAEIKGQGFKTFLEIVKRRWGSATERELLDRLPEEMRRQLLHGGIVRSGWYPVAWYRSLYTTLGFLLPEERDLAATIGILSAQQELSGIYSFVLKLTSPELIARHIDKILATYMRGGEVTTHVKKGEFVGVFSLWKGLDTQIWTEIGAGGSVVFEATGVGKVRTGLKETGGHSAVLTYHW